MSIIVKKGDVNIQNYVKKGGHLKNVFKGPVVFGSGTHVKGKEDGEHIPSDEQVKAALLVVKDRIITNRLWFAIYRPLVQMKKVKDGMFDAFQSYIEGLLSELPKPIDPRDLQSKMDVQSFQKNVDEWDPDDAPVAGKTFMTYFNLAKDFLSLISEPDDDDDDEDDDDEDDDD